MPEKKKDIQEIISLLRLIDELLFCVNMELIL